jgi:putative hydrolase of the HAD superfamily
MPTIKAIVFDLDNTLIDFMQMKEEACKGAVRAMLNAGLNMDEEEAYTRLMKTYFALGLESDLAFTEFLKRENQFNHKILAAAINAYLMTKTEFVKPYPNVKTTLQKLREKGIVLVIVTDAPKTKAYQRLLAMEIEPYFTFVVGFEDTNKKKQSRLPLMFALEKLKEALFDIHPREVLMVGDSIIRDLQPAKELGLKTALATYGQRGRENGTVDYELMDIEELEKLV